MSTITLEAYERAEREIAVHEAAAGLRVHAIVTVLVLAILITVNMFVASEFPWSAFAVAGMGIGLYAHWFGTRHTDEDMRRRQREIEHRAEGTPKDV